MRGRYPSGPDCLNDLPGSGLAKERARAILETITGQRRVQEVCDALHISEQRFRQLRTEMMTASIGSMEPGHAGRPRHTLTPEQMEILQLKQRLADKEVELKAAEARAEIALILPRVRQDSAAHNSGEPEKKTRPRRRATPGRRKST
jgi:hypothetical protein